MRLSFQCVLNIKTLLMRYFTLFFFGLSLQKNWCAFYMFSVLISQIRTTTLQGLGHHRGLALEQRASDGVACSQLPREKPGNLIRMFSF